MREAFIGLSHEDIKTCVDSLWQDKCARTPENEIGSLSLHFCKN
jgi:hypothetical protein